MLTWILVHKWHSTIDLIIQYERFKLIALIDLGADSNYIQEGLIPIKYYEKTLESLGSAGGQKLIVKYKLSRQKYVKIKYVLLLPSY